MNAVEISIGSVLASTSTANMDVPNLEPLELVQVHLVGPEGQQIVVNALPDTGANVTAIPITDATTCKPTKTNMVLRSADHTALKTLGIVQMEIKLRGKSTFDNVFVVENLNPRRTYVLHQVR